MGIIIGAGVAAVIAVGAGAKWVIDKVKARKAKKAAEASTTNTEANTEVPKTEVEVDVEVNAKAETIIEETEKEFNGRMAKFREFIKNNRKKKPVTA
jgi:DNA polymerase II small subunit/DNA polymerase delta subunit B